MIKLIKKSLPVFTFLFFCFSNIYAEPCEQCGNEPCSCSFGESSCISCKSQPVISCVTCKKPTYDGIMCLECLLDKHTDLIFESSFYDREGLLHKVFVSDDENLKIIFIYSKDNKILKEITLNADTLRKNFEIVFSYNRNKEIVTIISYVDEFPGETKTEIYINGVLQK